MPQSSRSRSPLRSFIRRAIAFLLILLLATAAPALAAPAATTWYVAVSGSDATGDGSPTAPFATIQHALDASLDGDTVIVLPGAYRENVDFKGKSIALGSRYLQTRNEDDILLTVIDGGRHGHTVSFGSGQSTPRLAGFTITNGYATGDEAPDVRGGGVFCWEGGSPALDHLRVVGNEAAGEGGGLFFAHCSPVIRDVYVAHNHAGENGGGLRYSYSPIDVQNLVAVENTSGSGGSGMFFYHSDGAIRNALIAGNYGGGKGGGLGFDGSSPAFINVTIAANRTSGNGGGLNVSYLSRPELVNSIVWGNLPEQVYFDTQWGGQALAVDHSDVQGGRAGIVTNGMGPLAWGPGNFDLSPLFVHPGLGDYRLGEHSPAIGAGTLTGAPAVDLEDHPRPNPPGSNPDVGAYESPLPAPVPGGPFHHYLPLTRTTGGQ